MDTIIEQALDKMISEVDELTDELNKNPLFERIKQKKRLINEFSKAYGGDTIYNDDSIEVLRINPGQFKGSTLSKAVRWFLEQRGKENPPSFDEIRDALRLGDYDGKVTDIRKVIMKNNQITLLRGGNVQRFGLTEWYGRRKRTVKDESGEDVEIEEDAEDDDESQPFELTSKKTNEENK